MADDRRNVKVGTGEPVRDGIGCVLMAIAFAIFAWAMDGFPGLPRG